MLLRRILLISVIVIAFAASFYKSHIHPDASVFFVAPVYQIADTKSMFESRFASSKPFISVHAGSMVELKNGS